MEGLSVAETFRTRHSVRIYNRSLHLTPETAAYVDSVVSAANAMEVPFGTGVSLGLHSPGLGKNVRDEIGWVVAKIPRSILVSQWKDAFIDVAIRLQFTSLSLFQADVSTTWMLDMFKRSIALDAAPGFHVPVGLAYGLIGPDDMMNPRIEWEASRLPFDKLFFDTKLGPLSESNAGPLHSFLDALRSGPSRMNGQPWRFLIDGTYIHLYNVNGIGTSWFDIGIAAGNIVFWLSDKEVRPVYFVLEHPLVCPLGGRYALTMNFA